MSKFQIVTDATTAVLAEEQLSLIWNKHSYKLKTNNKHKYLKHHAQLHATAFVMSDSECRAPPRLHAFQQEIAQRCHGYKLYGSLVDTSLI